MHLLMWKDRNVITCLFCVANSTYASFVPFKYIDVVYEKNTHLKKEYLSKRIKGRAARFHGPVSVFFHLLSRM